MPFITIKDQSQYYTCYIVKILDTIRWKNCPPPSHFDISLKIATYPPLQEKKNIPSNCTAVKSASKHTNSHR